MSSDSETPMPTITPFDTQHLEGALRLSQAVNWPHRLEDWAMVAGIGQGVVAAEGGQVIGTALCVPFGDMAAITMIIVADTHQGQGLGRRLMDEVLALAGARRKTLVATAEGLPLYRKLGFAPVREITQHQGIAAEAPAPGQPIRRGGPEDLDHIAALDLAATGMDRRALLARILAEGTLFLGEGGFACRRHFGRGQVIGPVIAPDLAQARALLHAAASGCAGQFLRVDIPDGAGLEPDLAALGLVRVGGGTEMHAPFAADPAPRHPARFALVSQALG